jgi:hypothetical protein
MPASARRAGIRFQVAIDWPGGVGCYAREQKTRLHWSIAAIEMSGVAGKSTDQEIVY